MSTPTPTPRTCGEISCDECNDRYAALAAERDQLRAEVERLRSDRDCEKRLRKDSDEFRENAIERAQRAEAEVERLNALGSWAHTCIHHTDEERKAWAACPCCSIARAERAEADLAAERARLDWVFHNCKVTSDDFTVHDREDLGVAMKEDVK